MRSSGPAFRRPTWRLTWLLTAWLALGAAAPGWAQQAPQGDKAETASEAAAEAPEEPTGPEPIAIPMIANRGEELRALFREIRSRIGPDEGVVAIEEELEPFAKRLAEDKQQVDELLAGAPTRSALSDIDRSWAGLGEDLADWQKTLEDRAATIEEEIAALDGAEEVWKVTLDAVTEAQAPSEVSDAVRASLNDIAEFRKEVDVPRSAVLSLLNRLSEQETLVADVRASVSESRASLQARLFQPDGDPLWTAMMADRSAQGPVSEELREGWQRVATYLRDASRELVPLGFFFLVSLGVAFMVRREVRQLGDTSELQGSAAVFERPVSTAILATFFLFSWVFRDAPGVVGNFVGLLMVFPILRLGTTLVAADFRPMLFTIGAFYFVDQLRDLVASRIMLQRLVLLVECGVAVGVLYWMLRPARLAGLQPGDHPSRWIGTGMQLAGVLLAGAILANLFGYVSFAEVLGTGVFRTVYLGVVLYAAFKIAQTLLVLFLSSERVRALPVVRAESGHLLLWAPRILGAVALFAGARGSLTAFGIREPVEGWLVDVLTTPVVFGDASISLWDVASFVIVVLAAWVFSRIAQALLEDSVLPRVRLRRGMGATITTSLRYVVLVLGFLFALSVAGIDMTKFTILAGAFGVGIGFGMQNIVNNFVSGLILLYERPIQVGDTIQLADVMGNVTRIGVRSSTLRTFQGAEVIVPNANLIAEQVVNWTLSDTSRRIELPVGVAYGCDHEQVLRVLEEASAGHPDVLDVPARQVLFQGFGESSLDFQVRLWTRSDSWTQVASDVLGRIYKGLNEAGIEIPFPQRDLHVRSVDEEAAKLLLGDAEPVVRRRSEG